MQLLGYADRLSVPPGSPIQFKVSCAHPWFVPELVRLRRGGSALHEVDLVEDPVPAELPARVPGRVQATRSGSYLDAPVDAGCSELTLAVWLKPTSLTEHWQAALSVRGDAGELSLAVSRRGVALLVGDTEAATLGESPARGQWIFVAARVDASGSARLSRYRPGETRPARAIGTRPARATETTGSSPNDGPTTSPAVGGGLIRVGALARPSGPSALFNGKLARPVVATAAWDDATLDRLAGGADPVTFAGGRLCALDLAADPGGCSVPDRGGLTGGARVVNLPTRGIPGPFWTGAETDFRRAPAEFDAVHLHSDDLADAGWATDLTWTVPPDLPSGVYALKLTAGDRAETGDRAQPGDRTQNGDRAEHDDRTRTDDRAHTGDRAEHDGHARNDDRAQHNDRAEHDDHTHIGDRAQHDQCAHTGDRAEHDDRARTGDRVARDVDRIPFVVTPAPAPWLRPEPPVLLILPTWTYLAYANWRTYAEHEQLRVQLYGERRGVDPRDYWLAEHPELGRSLYDQHSDGSGVAYSSRLRPILNIRPDYFTPTTRGFRHFAQDLQLIEWLDRRGEQYAVATDDELEREGVALLSRYRVVLTGSHPEYCSAGMLDSYLHYTHTGGRLMYLGGNGFYQVTARHPGQPAAIEIRRGHAGVATWTSEPGETHLSATGEPGGLWRLRGRPPNLLAGVGFTAQGFDAASGYRRTPASAEPSVAWAFDGVRAGVGELFGTEGPGLRGAAGDELDRADTLLGTPADAVVLASSEGHSSKIELVPEEADPPYTPAPDGIHPKVRSDVVLLSRPGGGAVFSVGSIAWSTAMTHNDGDNDVSRLTGNVLDRFRDAPGDVRTPQEGAHHRVAH